MAKKSTKVRVGRLRRRAGGTGRENTAALASESSIGNDSVVFQGQRSMSGFRSGSAAAAEMRSVLTAEAARAAHLSSAEIEAAHIYEIILGRDDRQRVTDTSLDPFNAICSLDIRTAAGQRFVGTGWLAGPRLVITAGHCAFDRDEGRFMSEIRVSPGLDGNNSAQSQVARRFRTNLRYVDPNTPDSQIPEIDYAAIFLDEPFDDNVGFFGYTDYSDDELKDLQAVNVVGYPADKMPPPTMWGHALPLSAVTERRLIYKIDTFGGHSGSPVFQLVAGSNGDPPQFIAVGIHNSGSEGAQRNYAARIVTRVAELIDKWREDSEA